MRGTRPQHLDALELANYQRISRSHIRRGLKTRHLTLEEAFDHPHAQRMTLFDLLRHLPRHGKIKAQVYLRDLKFSESIRLVHISHTSRKRVLAHIDAATRCRVYKGT